MRPFLPAIAALLVATGASARQSDGVPPRVKTIPIAEVQGADAMALAAKVLPAEIRAQVVQGSVGRMFLPGYVFRATYHSQPKVAGPDLCARTRYWLDMTNAVPGKPADPGADLVVKPVMRGEQRAIAFPARGADPAGCAAIKGYISVSGNDDDARKLDAYRKLVDAIRQARAPGQTSFTPRCEPIDDEACRDARQALASLPLDTLFGIDVDSGEKRPADFGNGGIYFRVPIRPGQPYGVEVSLGMSGKDGKSWRITWRETGEPLSVILLKRTSVVYH